jgi:16S rRNA (cytosine967-C5)-methyltransferase
MSRYHSYLNSAIAILAEYNGQEPFGSFLKKYFAEHKKFGSKDRKQVSHLCYCYFRLGDALPDIPVGEKILTALFLCSDETNPVLEKLKPEWQQWLHQPPEEKITLAGLPISAIGIFPWQNELSAGIDKQTFTFSHLTQPDLFLRLRPGKEAGVKAKLSEAGIDYEEINADCLRLSNASKVDTVIELDRDAVVQDLNSQRVAEFMLPVKRKDSAVLRIWDCCAASGGKSILATDTLGGIDLTVSDIRQSIIVNLEKRFARAGIGPHTSFVTDLSKGEGTNARYDLVIADVPCSGSGTWGRTPEQLYYFDGAKINHYASLQRKILERIVPAIHPGGHLLYITCSVFEKENEAQTEWLKEKFHLQVLKMELLKGYDKKADTLFAALLQRPL